MDWIFLLFIAGWVFFPLVLIDSMSKRRAKWDFFRCEKRLRVRVCTSRKLLRPLILRECMRNGTEHTTSHIAKQLRLWFIFYTHILKAANREQHRRTYAAAVLLCPIAVTLRVCENLTKNRKKLRPISKIIHFDWNEWEKKHVFPKGFLSS